MNKQEVDIANSTIANATRGSMYTIYTNIYIEHLPNKLTTTPTSDRQVCECTYRSGRYRAFEDSLRTICRLKVYIYKKIKLATVSSKTHDTNTAKTFKIEQQQQA